MLLWAPNRPPQLSRRLGFNSLSTGHQSTHSHSHRLISNGRHQPEGTIPGRKPGFGASCAGPGSRPFRGLRGAGVTGGRAPTGGLTGVLTADHNPSRGTVFPRWDRHLSRFGLFSPLALRQGSQAGELPPSLPPPHTARLDQYEMASAERAWSWAAVLERVLVEPTQCYLCGMLVLDRVGRGRPRTSPTSGAWSAALSVADRPPLQPLALSFTGPSLMPLGFLFNVVIYCFSAFVVQMFYACEMEHVSGGPGPIACLPADCIGGVHADRIWLASDRHRTLAVGVVVSAVLSFGMSVPIQPSMTYLPPH